MRRAILIESNLQMRPIEMKERLLEYRVPKRVSSAALWGQLFEPEQTYTAYHYLFTRSHGDDVYGADGIEQKTAYAQAVYSKELPSVRSGVESELRAQCDRLALEYFDKANLIDEALIDRVDWDESRGLAEMQLRCEYIGRAKVPQ